MAGRKKAQPAWQVILEDMRSLNRATIEAVETSRESLERTIDRIDRETRLRDAVLEAGIRDLRLRDAALEAGIRDLRAEFGHGRVEARLNNLEGRVEALEKA